MSRVKISTLLKSLEDETKFIGNGILNDNKLKFEDNGVIVSLTFKNDEEILFKRTTNDYTISMTFKNKLTNNGIYDIKSDSMQIPIEVSTENIIIKEGYICIVYELVLGGHNQGKFTYEIWYEVIE